jgi:hypothetical protein
MQFLRDSKGKKVGVVLAIVEFERLSEASEELGCLCPYDKSQASGEAPIPYEQVCEELSFHESERFKPASLRIKARGVTLRL